MREHSNYPSRRKEWGRTLIFPIHLLEKDSWEGEFTLRRDSWAGLIASCGSFYFMVSLPLGAHQLTLLLDHLSGHFLINEKWVTGGPRKKRFISLLLLVPENISEEVFQAVTKDLTSSSKFSGSCVLTLQTLPNYSFKVLSLGSLSIRD